MKLGALTGPTSSNQTPTYLAKCFRTKDIRERTMTRIRSFRNFCRLTLAKALCEVRGKYHKLNEGTDQTVELKLTFEIYSDMFEILL